MSTVLIEQPAIQPLRNRLNPNTWVDKYFDFLYMYTISRINCNELAKDLVQETFMAGLKAAKNFKGNASERTWLVSILKRKIVDQYRKKNSKKGRAEVSMNNWWNQKEQMNWLEEFVADPHSSGENDFIENKELGKLIENCISKLPKRYAEAFTLVAIKGYSTEVVCELLNVKEGNLWVILHRSREALKSCISQNWFACDKYGQN